MDDHFAEGKSVFCYKRLIAVSCEPRFTPTIKRILFLTAMADL